MTLGAQLIARAGEFWLREFGQRDVLNMLGQWLNMGADQIRQDLEEARDVCGIDVCPTFHREWWHPIVLDTGRQGEPLVYDAGAHYDTAGDTPEVARVFAYDDGVGAPDARAYAIGSGIRRVRMLCNRLVNPTLILLEGVDFTLRNGVLTIAFDPFARSDISSRVTDRDGVTTNQALLWGFCCDIDLEYLWYHYGSVLGVQLASSEAATEFTRALYANTLSPTIENVRRMISAMTGVPLAAGDETVEVIFTQPDAQVVVTDRNAYRLPVESVVSVSVGEALAHGQALSDSLSVVIPGARPAISDGPDGRQHASQLYAPPIAGQPTGFTSEVSAIPSAADRVLVLQSHSDAETAAVVDRLAALGLECDVLTAWRVERGEQPFPHRPGGLPVTTPFSGVLDVTETLRLLQDGVHILRGGRWVLERYGLVIWDDAGGIVSTPSINQVALDRVYAEGGSSLLVSTASPFLAWTSDDPLRAQLISQIAELELARDRLVRTIAETDAAIAALGVASEDTTSRAEERRVLVAARADQAANKELREAELRAAEQSLASDTVRSGATAAVVRVISEAERLGIPSYLLGGQLGVTRARLPDDQRQMWAAHTGLQYLGGSPIGVPSTVRVVETAHPIVRDVPVLASYELPVEAVQAVDQVIAAVGGVPAVCVRDGSVRRVIQNLRLLNDYAEQEVLFEAEVEPDVEVVTPVVAVPSVVFTRVAVTRLDGAVIEVPIVAGVAALTLSLLPDLASAQHITVEGEARDPLDIEGVAGTVELHGTDGAGPVSVSHTTLYPTSGMTWGTFGRFEVSIPVYRESLSYADKQTALRVTHGGLQVGAVVTNSTGNTASAAVRVTREAPVREEPDVGGIIARYSTSVDERGVPLAPVGVTAPLRVWGEIHAPAGIVSASYTLRHTHHRLGVIETADVEVSLTVDDTGVARYGFIVDVDPAEFWGTLTDIRATYRARVIVQAVDALSNILTYTLPIEAWSRELDEGRIWLSHPEGWGAFTQVWPLHGQAASTTVEGFVELPTGVASITIEQVRTRGQAGFIPGFNPITLYTDPDALESTVEFASGNLPVVNNMALKVVARSAPVAGLGGAQPFYTATVVFERTAEIREVADTNRSMYMEIAVIESTRVFGVISHNIPEYKILYGTSLSAMASDPVAFVVNAQGVNDGTRRVSRTGVGTTGVTHYARMVGRLADGTLIYSPIYTQTGAAPVASYGLVLDGWHHDPTNVPIDSGYVRPVPRDGDFVLLDRPQSFRVLIVGSATNVTVTTAASPGVLLTTTADSSVVTMFFQRVRALRAGTRQELALIASGTGGVRTLRIGTYIPSQIVPGLREAGVLQYVPRQFADLFASGNDSPI